jgi:hypothetical protein
VYHYRFDANPTKVSHVLRERLLQSFVDHGVAAKLDDHYLAVKVLQPWQRLDQGFGFDGREI